MKSEMKNSILSLIYVFLSIGCLYFAFKGKVNDVLGITLAIVGAILLILGMYKSWRCGIIKDVLDIIFHL